MARKKVGAIEEDLILVAALGIGVYLLVKNIPNLLPDFLKGGSSESQNTVQQINTVPPVANPFSYQYQYGLYAQAPGSYGSAFWHNLKSQGDTNTTASGGVYDYYVNGEVLNNAMGTFVEADADVDTVFNSLTNQADVANIAAYLYFNYGQDLMSLLTNGRGIVPLVNHGLSTDHLATIISHVNSLPQQ